MKKIMTWIFALLMAFPCGAGMEERPALRILESQRVIEQAWRREGIALLYEKENYDRRVPLRKHLTGENPPDLMYLSTYLDDFALLTAQGWLADLSDCPAARDAVASLRPCFAKLFTGPQGQIWGIPHVLAIDGDLYWLPAAWQAAGLREGDVPDSLEALLRFLEEWGMEDHPGFSVFRIGADRDVRYPSSLHTVWLIGRLIDAWAIQAQYAGEDMDFQRAEFVSLLNRCLAAGRRLDEMEGDGPNAEKMPLFFVGRGRGNTEGGEETYTLAHLIPLRVAPWQPNLLPVRAQLLCVRAGSPWAAEAASMAAAATRAGYGWSEAVMLPIVDPAAYNQAVSYPAAAFTREWLDSIDRFDGILCLPMRSVRSCDGYHAALARLLSGAASPGEFARALTELWREILEN